MAAALAMLILAGRCFGFYDPGGRSFEQADNRRMTVAGNVAQRQLTAGGYRILLDHISFPISESSSSSPEVYNNSGQSEIYKSAAAELNAAIRSSDRIIIYFPSPDSDDYDEKDPSYSLRTGETAVFRGRCSEPDKPTNPGQFDSQSYYRARNIILFMTDPILMEETFTGTAQDVSGPSYNMPVWKAFAKNLTADLRISMQKGMTEVFGEEDAALACAVLLGDKSALDSSDRKLFQDGGMTFLITVSSMHIMLLGMLIYRFLRGRGLSFAISGALSSSAVLGYASLTGFSLSAQRASVMFIIRMGAQIPGRKEDRLSSLGMASFLILLRQPYALFDSSFIISCVSCLSIELIPGLLEGRHARRHVWLRGLIRSASLQIGTLPVFLWFFYQIPSYSILFHMILLPCMSLLMMFGLAGSLLGVLSSYLVPALSIVMRGPAAGGAAHALLLVARAIGAPAVYILRVFRSLCGLEMELPGALIILGRPAVSQVILYYVLLFACAVVINICRGESGRWGFLFTRQRLSSKRGRHAGKKQAQILTVTASAMVLLLSMLAAISVRIRPALRYTCLDVGQGSCNLIEERGHALLFDAGSSSVDEVWQYRIESTLKYYGISYLDAVILSHGDLDHICGIEQMLETYHLNITGRNAFSVTVGRLLLPSLPYTDDRLSEVKEKAKDKGIGIGYLQAGDVIQTGNMRLDILSPSADRIIGESNQDSMVLWLEKEGLRMLLPGDLEKDGEDMLVEAIRKDPEFPVHSNELNDTLTILVAGHHGSKNATSEELLELIKPDIVLISCGRNNRYGHPAAAMLKRLEDAGVPWKRTDLEGAVTIQIR